MFENKIIKKHQGGFTLLELIISLGIFSLIVVGAGAFFGYALKTQTLVWDQLEAQSEGRKSLQQMTDLLRKAEESSTGAYSIESANTSSLVFYANIDSDGYKERIRFFLSNKTLKRGIIKPSGNPLTYNTSSEQFLDLAHYVVNAVSSTPVFLYYDESYTGTGAALVQPVDITKVRVIRLQLQIEKDVSKSPIPLFVESVVSIRNLKSN